MKNLLQQLKDYEDGKFKDSDHNTQVAAGWYDWFCSGTVLPKKTDQLYRKVKRLLKADAGRLIDPEKCYVSFKSIYPIEGRIFDCIRFFPIDDEKETHHTIIVVPRSGFSSDHSQAQLTVYFNKFGGLYQEYFSKYAELLIAVKEGRVK